MTTSPTCTIIPGRHERTRGEFGDLLAVPVGRIEAPLADAIDVFACASGVCPIVADVRDPAIALAICQDEIDRVRAADFNQGTHLDVTAVLEGDRIVLTWNGCFTPGRRVAVSWQPGDDRAVLTWDTGTGAPSWWIGRALARCGLASVDRREIARHARRLSPERHGRLIPLAR
jgi:hypothetical protein